MVTINISTHQGVILKAEYRSTLSSVKLTIPFGETKFLLKFSGSFAKLEDLMTIEHDGLTREDVPTEFLKHMFNIEEVETDVFELWEIDNATDDEQYEDDMKNKEYIEAK